MAATPQTSQYPNPTSPTQASPHSSVFSPKQPQHGNSSGDDKNNDGDGWSGDEGGSDKDDSKKRKRPMSVSCELCKQRKVKCDRGQPSCGWCLRNHQVCEYKERKKPGLRAGYGRELESRLDRLEAVIQTQQQALSQLTNGALPPTIHNLSSSPISSQDANNIFATQAGNVAANHAPQAEMAVMTPVTTSPYTPQPQQPQQGMGDFRGGYGGFAGSYQQGAHDAYQKPDNTSVLQQQQQQQASQPYYDATMTPPALNMPAGPPAPVSSQDHELPPYDLLYSLANLYFKNINTWCPILHRKSTVEALFGPSSLDEGDRVLLHAIVATTLRFSPDERLDIVSRERYYSTSKHRVLLYGMENSSVRALQAMVILALDICGSANGPPGWNLLALITRSAVQLGLSIEASSPSVSPRVASIYTLRAMVLPEPSSWIEEESRRRLFWMIYILDRYGTITTAFEFALDEKEIDRKLPCRDDLFSRNQPVETRWFNRDQRPEKGEDKPENLGSFSYYVEVMGILSRIHQFLKGPVDIRLSADVEKWQDQYRELDAMLTSWKTSLPKEYGNTARLFDANTGNKIVNCGWVMLHATYHTTVIRLHSSAGYPARRSAYFAPSLGASQRCLAAVESISALCTHVKNNQMLTKLGPPFAFSVWVAARLLLVHSSTVEHQVDPNIQFFVDTLRELGAYWNVAERYATLLQRVLEEFSESEQAASNHANGERETPSSVKILADMRRCAYDLDFLISRQPRQQLAASNNVFAPSKTPVHNDLEYLDVFDFFNVPRLPEPAEGGVGSDGASFGVQTSGVFDAAASNEQSSMPVFAYDASTDWIMKQE